MNIWIISDTHFSHKNIIQYENRPFDSVYQMNQVLIYNWNWMVKPQDIVYHLGDVALGPAEMFMPIMSQLNGRKILIRGNHDRKGRQWYLEHGFEAVHPYLVLDHDGRTILLTHRPEDHLEQPRDLHFYGHIHSKTHHGEEPNAFPTVAHNGACVCVERWGYYPIELDALIYLCDNADNFCPYI